MPDELKALRLKLKEAGSRLADQKVTNGNLKTELDKAKRLLVKEVGEGVALETLQGDGWRGRGQQISLLKDKLKETRRQVSSKALSLPCASTVFLSKTAPFLAVCLSLPSSRPRPPPRPRAAGRPRCRWAR
eukprot:SAG22_NODE_1527_length_4219_cov_8.734466_4_plen_130_part_01